MVRLFLAVLLALTATAAAAEPRNGAFTGSGKYNTSGTVVVDGRTLRLQRNFNFQGAPDARLAFGNARSADRGTIFARLQRNKGAQNYTVPRNVNTNGYSHVWLWCKRFNVPLGRAALR
ncbi:MAG: DM13 domain-containing protein [Pseudomonadota bacterium]